MKKMMLLLCYLMSGIGLFAFTHIPQDTSVIKGVLPCGLTYYIRHNDYIPNRAAFHIAQKVGSIQEEREQRGLAHFLEHMAFNGTHHFPNKSLINYLETIGVRFGENLNAYTSVDETVYMITDVPTLRTATVDSCLLILRDWSDGISLEAEAIDSERGVIEEEWRTRNNPFLRSIETISPTIYAGDKYSDCMPIGNIDVVRNFSHEVLRDYYRTWYRPDLQGIIIVGDVDIHKTEESIKRIFADAKQPTDAPERIYYPVSDYKEPCIVISTDAEMPYSMVTFSQKVEDLPYSLKDTEEDFEQDYIRFMTASMLSDRLSDISKEEVPPFSHASAYYGTFMLSGNQKCFEVSVQMTSAGAEIAFTRMMEEIEKVRRFGFTESELERVKKSYLALAEQTYNHRNQHNNGYYVQLYIDNFLKGEALTSAEKQFELHKRISSQISISDINDWVGSWNANNVLIWCMGSNIKELPTEEFIKNELVSLPSKKLEVYDDVFLPESIIPENLTPVSGKIKNKKHLKNGIIEYKLSNDVCVQFKQTDFKDDEILFSAESIGGCIMVDSTDYINARFTNELFTVGGIGTMNAIQLEKFMADKRASLSVSVDVYTEGLNGYASKKDIKYLFELLYASFTAVRTDSTAYLSFIQRFMSNCKDRDKYPLSALSDSIESVLYANNKLYKTMDIPDLKELDYTRSLEIFKQRFSNATDFKYTIVGSIDEATLEPLLEKYMASLPVSKQCERLKKADPLIVSGSDSLHFNNVMQVPATIVFLHDFVSIKSSERLAYSLLDDILDIVYTEKVREEQGGTYGVSARISINKYPTNYAELIIQFSTDSSKVETLLPIVYAELKNIAENGPRLSDLQKVKEYARKDFTDKQKNNNYWLTRIHNAQISGKDLDTTFLRHLDKISAKDIQRVAKQFVSTSNHKEVVMIGIK